MKMTDNEIIEDLRVIVNKYIDIEHPEYTSDDRRDVIAVFDGFLAVIEALRDDFHVICPNCREVFTVKGDGSIDWMIK